jgi:branched-subunit amino acid transport protein AzlD
MSAFAGEWGAYLALILVGFLPNEIWRWLGVIFARGLDEDSEIVVWVRSVATAILAGVIAKLTLFAPGVLATVPLGVRIAAIVVGFAAFMAVRRSVFAGVLVGEIALVAGGMIWTR